MPPKSPILGSLAFQAPSSSPQFVHVSSSTCHDLSSFKELLKEYRKLDDAVPMRLNRTLAQFRDRDRVGAGGKGSIQDQACVHLWKDLVGQSRVQITRLWGLVNLPSRASENWKRRTEIIGYCVQVMDQSMGEKRKSMDEQEGDPSAQRRIQGALFAEEVKRNQVHNELVVEKIIRQRSLDAFSSRCRYFQPPLTDAEARQWWEGAARDR